ncbi:tRNA (adenosine(37)-N6)-threonylcarbamoyltransferase complex ATPase subunit type 1 TsaE [Geosporobacter ferrireducens]|uniref:tRNA (adenosine(37)-N6)-threonylcarbamoyltransferase complex ATPase subunit type 1 TsaE n=1 Tax=Geosporobacter ferrireducens TaxID=1424294 RepID=UPI00139C3993|nr:tRNA (adenosine(37)-N6)-threonylcarbamoyltransferase complex ATPase subunit type 1 TsaE [Geosporobacter ferrireducens]MTI53457.1 tRNA (adenosine(37)-N6)-threonylcarbamoyltransferase complex ATPase subunit type 1 TsaE [Geosporobacter ferrireducens]
MIKLTSHDPKETDQIGYKLGTLLQKGDVVCLTGDLGAGKTTMTQAIARGLGVKEDVTSPTFALIHEYNGRMPVYHFDVYRIRNIEELEDLGYEEYFYGQGVCIIEWASQIREVIPKEHLWIHIQQGVECDSREIRIEGTSARFDSIMEELSNLC